MAALSIHRQRCEGKYIMGYSMLQIETQKAFITGKQHISDTASKIGLNCCGILQGVCLMLSPKNHPVFWVAPNAALSWHAEQLCAIGCKPLRGSLKVSFLILAGLCRLMEVVHQQGDLHHKSWGLVHDWDWTTGHCTMQQVPLCLTSFRLHADSFSAVQ